MPGPDPLLFSIHTSLCAHRVHGGSTGQHVCAGWEQTLRDVYKLPTVSTDCTQWTTQSVTNCTTVTNTERALNASNCWSKVPTVLLKGLNRKARLCSPWARPAAALCPRAIYCAVLLISALCHDFLPVLSLLNLAPPRASRFSDANHRPGGLRDRAIALVNVSALPRTTQLLEGEAEAIQYLHDIYFTFIHVG